MAIEKQINIVVKETGIDSVNKKVSQLDTSLEGLQTTQKSLAKSMGESSNSVLENGGAMGLLNDATGGLAMTVKDAVEATALFAKNSKIAAMAQAFYTTVVGTSTGAMKLFRIALVSTGIGAIVVGIGLLIANFDKVKKAVLNLVPGLAIIGDLFTGLVETVGDFVGVTSDASRELDKLGSDAEKTLAKNQFALEAYGDKYDEFTKRKIEANNKYASQVKTINENETLSETEKLKRLKILRETADREIFKSEKDRNDKIAKTRKEAQDKIDEADKKAKEIKDAKNAKLIEEETQKAKDLAKAKADAEMESAKDALAIQNELLQSQETPAQKEEREYQERKEVLEKNNLSTELLEADHKTKMKAIDEDYWSKQADASIEQTAKDKEEADKKLAIEEALNEAKFQIANKAFDLLNVFVKKGSKIAKGVAVAQATMNTYQGITSALAAPSIVPEPFGTALKIANSVAIGVTGFMNVKKILATDGEGKGGGGASSGGGGASIPSAPSFNLVAGTGSNQIAEGLAGQRQPLQAYVVSGAVTNAQQMQRNIVDDASL